MSLWDVSDLATPEPTPTSDFGNVDIPSLSPDGDYNCGDFDTHEQARTSSKTRQETRTDSMVTGTVWRASRYHNL